MIYPWQSTQWQQLWQMRNVGRLPHALALSGVSGLGKRAFANELAQALLCEHVLAEGFPCGSCQACHLIKSGAHPGLHVVQPEKEGHSIKIDQIRELIIFSQQTALIGSQQVIIISPACAMTINAANALLKILEEPSSLIQLILVIHHHERLPKTVISRCQSVTFALPKPSVALAWLANEVDSNQPPEQLLKLAYGVPLDARELATSHLLEQRSQILSGLITLLDDRTNLVALSSVLQKCETLIFIDIFLSWIIDIMRAGYSEDVMQLTNSDYANDIQRFANNMPVTQLSSVLLYIGRCRKMLLQGINLNKQLLFEDLMLRFLGCATHAS